MEEMMNLTIARLMSDHTDRRNRPKVEPKHIVKLPANNCPDSNCDEAEPDAVYAARAGDIVVLATVWKDGCVTIELV